MFSVLTQLELTRLLTKTEIHRLTIKKKIIERKKLEFTEWEKPRPMSTVSWKLLNFLVCSNNNLSSCMEYFRTKARDSDFGTSLETLRVLAGT